MKKKLFYTKPSLKYVSIESHGHCYSGSSAADGQGVCSNGQDTSIVASGNCGTGGTVVDANQCGSGSAINDFYCWTGGNASSDCYSGTAANRGRNACHAGNTVTT